MDIKKIKTAVDEAKRFIKIAEQCVVAKSVTHESGDYIFHATAPKESGATRRASMDLTRTLAELRKP